MIEKLRRRWPSAGLMACCAPHVTPRDRDAAREFERD